MSVRVVLPAKSKLTEVKVLQHTLHFDELGTADGSELTPEEISRLRRFHFRVEITKDPDEEKTNNALQSDSDEGTNADSEEHGEVTPPVEPVKEDGDVEEKPKTSRGRNKKDGE